MVKLLRLTSNKDDDFDGAQDGLVFNVNMDDDLIVSPNAQIALKNLTFETDFAAFLPFLVLVSFCFIFLKICFSVIFRLVGVLSRFAFLKV